MPSITQIDPVSGAAIRVETPLKNLDGKLYSYELRCESTLSQLNEGTANYFFQVRFYDECNDATITPPYFEDFGTEVFLGASVPYAPAQSDKVCGGFTYSIATPMTESWPKIGLQNGQIFIEPTLIPTHVGPWDVRLTACLELNNRCQTGPIGRITVTNPCLASEIVTAPINTIMRAPRLKFNDLSLYAEMGAAWPFSDSVDNKYAQIQNCGRILYDVLDVNGNALPGPPIVYLQNDVLFFQPQLSDPIATIPLILRAYLADYQFVPIF